MKTIAILNGFKLILPHYGKYQSRYGIFTTEGFITTDNEEVELIELTYNDLIVVNEAIVDMEYLSLDNPKW